MLVWVSKSGVAQPVARNPVDDVLDEFRGQPGAQLAISFAESTRVAQEHVVLNLLELIPRPGPVVTAAEVEVERCSVVDQIELLVPYEQVWIPDRAIHIGDVGVEPDDGRGQLRCRTRTDRGLESEGTGQIIDRQV